MLMSKVNLSKKFKVKYQDHIMVEYKKMKTKEAGLMSKYD